MTYRSVLRVRHTCGATGSEVSAAEGDPIVIHRGTSGLERAFAYVVGLVTEAAVMGARRQTHSLQQTTRF